MTPPNKFALIGAGGIGCVLAPLLAREAQLVIVDADSYEPGNSPRQFPALHSTANKAATLASLVEKQTIFKVQSIEAYAKDILITGREQWQGVDMIVGGVDNNASRRILIDIGKQLDLPVLLAGNEHKHGEAHLFLPEVYNPLDHFAFPEGEPTPWGCNNEKTLEEHPQTQIANIMAASAAMHLLLSYLSASDPLNCLVYTRLDVFSADSRRAKNILADAAAA